MELLQRKNQGKLFLEDELDIIIDYVEASIIYYGII